MSNVVGAVKGHLQSKAAHRRTRSSVDTFAPPNPAGLDGPFSRARGTSLRQQALAEEGEHLTVSSPKDKHFASVPWDDLKDRHHPDFFSPTPAPVPLEPKTSRSAGYVDFHNSDTFEHPRQVPAVRVGRGHHRTASTPPARSESASASAGRKPSLLLKRRPMPISKSEPSPASPSFLTINEIYEHIAKPQLDQPLSPGLLPDLPEVELKTTHEPARSTTRPPRSVDVLAYRPPRRDSLQNRQRPPMPLEQLPLKQTHTEPPATQNPAHTKALKPRVPQQQQTDRPTFIDLPRLTFPAELHVNTPEYTDALKQWFPAVANRDMHMQRTEKNARCFAGAATRDVGLCH
jgi:hypothetical protein